MEARHAARAIKSLRSRGSTASAAITSLGESRLLRDNAIVKRTSHSKTAAKRKRSSQATKSVTSGKTVAAVGREFVLIRTSKPRKAALQPGDTARSLLSKTGAALATPGISHQSVFRDARSGVFAYSVYPLDPSKVVRKSANGTRTIGRVVDGKFRSR